MPPRKPLKHILLLSLFCLVFGNNAVRADTVYLKNGNRFEGIVTREDDKSVELDIGSGTVAFSKKQIVKIYRSTREELEQLQGKMASRQTELVVKEKEFREARERRFDEYGKWVQEGLSKKPKASAAMEEIPLLKVENSKDIMAEVLIDGKVKATLILDTGSYDIVLTRNIGDKLGVDFSDTKTNMKEIHLTGKSRMTKTVLLKSIRIQEIEEKDLIADILLEDKDVAGLKDGLLGLAFLNRFNSVIDLTNMKLRLRRK